jgi:hypothetical protein
MKASKLDYVMFVDPPAEYRPVPFWGLNDELKDDVLRQQIREMKRKGWGGFFMHPRYGLITPYLSEEYMARVQTCVDEAKKQGIGAWIYDEHPWPSGGAGGLTAACNKEYRHKALVMRVHNRLTPIDKDELVSYYALQLDKDGIPCKLTRIEDPDSYHGGEHYYLHFYVFTENLHQSNEPGFDDDNTMHGFATSDNMNPKAVRRFIDVTYGSFYKAVGKDFGTTLLGGFSDMPVYNWNYGNPHPCIPWTTGFEEYFQKNFGYDIVPHLPSLFFDIGDDYIRIRCDYWKAVSTLFAESYTKQLYDWCNAHNLIYTAHYWGEETLHWQIPWAGDVMHHFIYQHYVGMDHSIKNIEDPIGIKQASSVAEQLGKPRMVSETYGMSGNNITHKQRKWIGDWEYALGTNFLVPYIAHYSLRGRRKRDEPASLFIQQAYWQDERVIYDYFGRLSYVLTTGERKIDILVLQPLASARALYAVSNYITFCHRPDPRVFEAAGATLYDYNQSWMNLCDSMLAIHRDFHIGNEVLMERYGSIEGNALRIGRYCYKAVIVPPSITWSASTVKLLDNFVKNGGIVIAIKPLPTMIDGVSASSVLPWNSVVIDDIEASLERELDNALEKDIVLPKSIDLLCHHRINGDEDIFYIANTSMKKEYTDIEIKVAGKGSIELWDAITGSRYNVPCREKDGYLVFVLDFYPVTSYVLIRKDIVDNGLKSFARLPHTFDEKILLDDEWEVETKDYNALVLDFCNLVIGTHRWNKIPVWKAHQYIKQGGLGQTYTLEFHFEIKEMVDELYYVVETPERFEMKINGQPLKSDGHSWWVDPAFRKIDLSHAVRVGINTVEITGCLGIDTEIENCVVIGHMSLEGVKGFSIIKQKQKVIGTDVTKEGFPFYTGRIVLCKSFNVDSLDKRIYVTFGKLDATYTKVRINGKPAGDLPWEPFTLEITGLVNIGKNRLEVELVSTRYNLFGPHHFKFGEEETFSVPDRWTNESLLTEEYFFTKLGITDAKVVIKGEEDQFLH